MIAVLAVFLGLAGPVTAGPFEDGLAAFNDGLATNDSTDFGTALKIFRPLAQQGDGRAGYYLGLMYQDGWGVPRDTVEAWKWYHIAAKQGDARAEYEIGRSFDYGLGVQQNYERAVKWYRTSAEQGFSFAQFGLGRMYEHGKAVPQDYVMAHKWFNLSVANFSADLTSALHLRNQFIESRDRVANLMTPAQIAEAQRLAREWKPKGAVE